MTISAEVVALTTGRSRCMWGFSLISRPITDFILQPWQLYLVTLAGWMNRQQQEVIACLRTENQVLKEKLGKRRLLLDDDQRRRLAVKGRGLGRRRLQEVGILFTPDTILRWHRMLVVRKWDYSDRREKALGRPTVSDEIRQLVVRMARENPSWGYDRIAGVLQNLGHDVLDQSVGNILKAHGIEPAPDRKRQTTWKTFLKAHWGVLAAIDFTTVEVWTKGGFVTYYLLFVMELKARRVHFAGCTVNPHEAWMKQTARELTSCDDGFLDGKRNLIMDRDTKFCESFRSILRQSDGEPVVLPRESPNLNSQLEKYFGSLKSRCLSRMIFLGKQSLERAVREYVEHHHRERNHQGLGNRLIDPGEQVGAPGGKVACSERLGGLLRNYHRSAESLFASDSSSLHHWMLTFRAEAIVLVLQHDRGRCSAFRRPKLRPEIVVNSTLREQTTCGPFQFFDLTIFQEQTP